MAFPLALSLLVTVAELRALPEGGVTILDARGAGDYRKGHLVGAVRADWLDYRDGWGRTGRLPEDLDGLARELGALGISDRRPVVVYGAGREGFGEEGRIAWMLLYLGHDDVRILDGGYAAWVRAGLPVETRAPARPLPGGIRPRPRPGLRAGAQDVAEAVRSGSADVLDVRTLEEWEGATPYHEARGGRIPGAKHLPWTELLDAESRLDRSGALRARLAALGLAPERPVITYCTAGVRAAEAALLLRELGFRDVRNYDGSFWEWAADRARPVAR